MNARKRYPSDLTDVQWGNIDHLFPQGNGMTGRPRTYPLREIVNAVLYLARGGRTWRTGPAAAQSMALQPVRGDCGRKHSLAERSAHAQELPQVRPLLGSDATQPTTEVGGTVPVQS